MKIWMILKPVEILCALYESERVFYVLGVICYDVFFMLVL